MMEIRDSVLNYQPDVMVAKAMMPLANEKAAFSITPAISKNSVCFRVDFQKESCNDPEERSSFVVHWDVEPAAKDNEWSTSWLSAPFSCNKDASRAAQAVSAVKSRVERKL